MIVVDASVIVDLLLRSNAKPIEVELASERVWMAPELLLVEVASVIRRLMLAKVLPKPRAAEAMADLKKLPLRLLAHRRLLDTAWTFAATASMYDATYLALALLSSATLLTRDAKLARAHVAKVNIRVV